MNYTFVKHTFTFLLLFLCFYAASSQVLRDSDSRFNLTQCIDPKDFRGKKFRLTVKAKVLYSLNQNERTWTGLWVQVFNEDNSLGFADNMFDRPIVSPNWSIYKIEGRIDTNAERLCLGGIAANTWGKVSFDDYRLEVEASNGKWKKIQIKNQDFEEKVEENMKIPGWGINFSTKTGYTFKLAKHSGKDTSKFLMIERKLEFQQFHTLKTKDEEMNLERVKLPKLPNEIKITCLFQDSNGFIWIGTTSGLFQYNGYELKSYADRPLAFHDLPNKHITCIFEDHQGYIWIGTIGSLSRLDLATDQFDNFFPYHDGDPNSLIGSRVTCIFEDKTNTLWVGTSMGLNRFNRNNNDFNRIFPRKNKFSKALFTEITSLDEDENGNLWIGTAGFGMARFDRSQKSFEFWIRKEKDPYDWGYKYINSTQLDREGRFWVATRHGLYHFNPKTFASKRFVVNEEENPTISNKISFITKDQDGNIWFLRDGKLCQFNFRTKSENVFQTFKYSGENYNGSFSSLLIDNTNSIWVSDEEGYLWKIRKNRNLFKNHGFGRVPEELFVDGQINAMLEDFDQNVWVWTKNRGLKYFSFSKENSFGFESKLDDYPQLKANRISSLVLDKEGNIWVGLGFEGLGYIERHTKEFHYIINEIKDNVGKDWVNCIHIDENDIWIGTRNSLLKYNIESKNFSKIPFQLEEGEITKDKYITSIYRDKNNEIWVGTNFGELFKYEKNKNIFIAKSVLGPKLFHQLATPINNILEDGFGNLWMSTEGIGLWEFDKINEEVRQFTESINILSENIKSTFLDRNGVLWLGSNKGITQFHPKTKSFINFRENNGLPLSNVRICINQKKSENLFFVTSQGFTSFHPDSISALNIKPPIYFSSLRKLEFTNNSVSREKVNTFLGEISIGENNDGLLLEITALSYQDTTKTRYAYKLEKSSSNWIDLGVNRKFILKNLKPGRYRLSVKAWDENGFWGPSEASVNILVLPAWFRSFWLKILLVLLLLTIGFTWNYIVIRRKIKIAEYKKIKELDETRTKLFTNITHEFRQPLSIILGMAEELKSNTENKSKPYIYAIKQNSNQLLNLINQLLELRKLEVGSLKESMVNGNILSFLNFIIQSFESYASQKNIRLHFYTDLDALYTDYDEAKMLTILSNLVSNAIKFTASGGNIYFNLNKQIESDNFFELTIRDTGIGIPPEEIDHIFDRFYQVDNSSSRMAEGTGIGLALTKELVELLKGSIQVESKVGEGTIFKLRFPISHQSKEKSTFGSNEVKNLAQRFVPPKYDDFENVLLADQKDKLPLILIVEDNEGMVINLKAFLRNKFRLVIASDGKEGLSKVKEILPDLIISDVMMPIMDGLELCKALRTDPNTNHIPIIFLTAKVDIASKIEGLEHGADDYLEKPFDRQELLVRIDNLLENRNKLRQYYQGVIEESDQLPGPFESLKVPKQELNFIHKLRGIVEERLEDNQFSVEELSNSVNMTSNNLARKLNQICGYPGNVFIRKIRLEKAKLYLRDSEKDISSIAYSIGLNDPAHFSRIFRKEYGLSPSAYREKFKSL